MALTDISHLLAPCSLEAPCGSVLEYRSDYIELMQAARGTPDVQYGTMQQDAVPPDWQSIARQAEGLWQHGHDLQLAQLLTRAWLERQGLQGLQHGLALIDGLLGQYWDSMHPQLDPQDQLDPTERSNILAELVEPAGMLGRLRHLPLLMSGTFGTLSLRAIEQHSGHWSGTVDEALPDPVALENICKDSPLTQLEAVYQALEECRKLITGIEQRFNLQAGVTQGIDLSSLGKIVQLGLQFLHVQQDKHPQRERTATTKTAAHEAETALTQMINSPTDGAIHSRRDVAEALQRIRDYYMQNEPSSPIPILLERAQQLLEMNFIELIQNLVPGSLPDIQNLRGPAAE